MEQQIKDWAPLGISIVALLFSFAGIGFSRRAVRLAERQEERKNPLLVPELREGYFVKRQDDARVYFFLLSVRNPTDSDNAIARIELHLRYLLNSGVPITAKFGPDKPNVFFDNRIRLHAPHRIGARDTVSGWCDFTIEAAALNGNSIDGYQIVLADSHGTDATVNVLVIHERTHAA